ncbi:transposase [Noviherbaspirillum sp. ST9]|uniref:Transposase n=2 Tax=Arcticibacter tournemirensis TaxID=699437 RepID=A0A4Q0M292_9SPHI|nr:transposase [Arcticibacter tournemirensis]
MKALLTEPKVYSKAFKEKLIVKVVYQNLSIKEVAYDHGLPNTHILSNWVSIYKRGLEKGAVSLPLMNPNEKDSKALKAHIKQLEKALEKANVMIYGLNSMIDYAEKELKVPLRKKHGTKQSR